MKASLNEGALRSTLAHALEIRGGRDRLVALTVLGSGERPTFRAQLASGQAWFIKLLPSEFAARMEAEDLAFLGEAKAIAVAEVRLVCSVGDQGALALDWLPEGRATPQTEESLGRGLAELHRYTRPAFGLSRDNFLASLPQSNASASRWGEFYAASRLLPLVPRLRAALSPDQLRDYTKLVERLPGLDLPIEPPATLHGDLWAGNCVWSRVTPTLIDPAAYAGHREMDLAMMRLFGGFGPRVFAAYEEAYPLTAGARERISLCQVYPLAAHVAMFGRSYAAQLTEAVRSWL